MPAILSELDRLYINLHNEFTDQFAALIGSNVDVIGPVVDVRCAEERVSAQPLISEAEEPEFFRHLPAAKRHAGRPCSPTSSRRTAASRFGMDHMIRHFGIAPEEVMAFGDGGNDLDMLVHAGIGVAMGNAVDSVKTQAGCSPPMWIATAYGTHSFILGFSQTELSGDR